MYAKGMHAELTRDTDYPLLLHKWNTWLHSKILNKNTSFLSCSTPFSLISQSSERNFIVFEEVRKVGYSIQVKMEKALYESSLLIRKCWKCLFAGAICALLLLFLQFINHLPSIPIPTSNQLLKGRYSEDYPEGSSTGHYNQYEQKDWQSTNHPEHKVWIYSAYSYDDEQVIIIASPLPEMFFEDSSPVVQCAFYSSQSSDDRNVTVKKTKAEVELMSGQNSFKGGTFIRCPLPTRHNPIELSASRRPSFVSVLLANQTESATRLPIKFQTLDGSVRPFQFALCVLPMYRYNQVFHFLEWVEFYKMMGVRHLTFHNRSIGPTTSCVLNHYTRNSLDGVTVKVHPWHNYPQKSDFSARGEEGEGRAPAINECYYSHRGLSKYLVYVDVDEFIAPLKDGIADYRQLFQYLEETSSPAENGDRVGEYDFRNGFYFKSRHLNRDPYLVSRCSGLKDSADEFHVCQQLWTMHYVKREPITNVPAPEQSWENRTKYIAVPEAVRNGGAHFVRDLEKGWASRKVDEDVAFSRHYRVTNGLGKSYSTKKADSRSVERIPLEMGLSLAKNVARSIRYFMKVCDLSLAGDVYG